MVSQPGNFDFFCDIIGVYRNFFQPCRAYILNGLRSLDSCK